MRHAGGVHQNPESLVVETGRVTFHVNRSWERLLDWRSAAERAEVGVRLVDAKGRRLRARLETLQVEAVGPLRTTVLLAGTLNGRRGVRFRVRLCFFNQTGLVRVRFTVHNSGAARHMGGLWDLGDRGSFLFKELAIDVAWAGGHKKELGGGKQQPPPPMHSADCPSPAVAVEWAAEPGEFMHCEPNGRVAIYQDSSGGENWQSRNHMNREGRVPCRFRGYRVQSASGERKGKRANPVVALSRCGAGVAVAVPEFWQQFPKAIAADATHIEVGLFPAEWDDLHELQGGEQKTHVVWFNFGDSIRANSLAWVHEAARLMPNPEWTADTEALPWFVPVGADRDVRLQNLLKAVVDGERSFFAGREMIDEYGWRNYGDVWADHEGAHYSGPAPVISHYNNQFDVVFGLLAQWLRTGEDAWWELADPLARHVADIDIYHTKDDRAAYNGGLFWFTDHYLEAATCSHRTYSCANAPTDGSSYGGGPSPEHNFTTGLLHYYYLTGCPEARDAVIELADWVLASEDGRQNILGLVDPGQTGLATHRGSQPFRPNRACGNSVQALVDGWQLSGRREYLELAEDLIGRVVHPGDDVGALELLNAEKYWSYTVFLASLANYLRCKDLSQEADRPRAYARACLLRYAAWMLEHERRYLERPEELEYPTEAWAAQEFRKANVLRLAAEHADPTQRQKLLVRATELAECAWNDLLSFELRHSARAMAVLMTEGLRDLYFRSRPLWPSEDITSSILPVDGISNNWGPRIEFVPQRQRVGERLRSARGLLQVAVRMANPANLWKARLRF
ncbi:MAG TPA: hypothetical protein VG826_32355 [Pirellulales bacterium]|nr:hypothetical protein [Pirellulales bacterium]